jgi:hypothetical protein
MLERFGVFDFFSYTLPGGIYLAAVLTALKLWPIAPALVPFKLDAPLLAILVVVAYLIGLLMSLVTWNPWSRLFRAQQLDKILEKLQRTYPDFTLNMKPTQWPVLQANTAFKDREFSLALDKLRATKLMLSGVSLALFFFAAMLLVYAIGHPRSLISWLGVVTALGASALAMKGSRKYKSWTYHYTFELMIARVVKPEDFVIRKDQ